MDSKNCAFNNEEKLLRIIYDIINESSECKENSLISYNIQKNAYQNIKKLFNPKNKYKNKAKNIIHKISIYNINYKCKI